MKKPVLGVSLVALAAAATVYPPCFEQQVKLILGVDKLEPPDASASGFKVVFVYKRAGEEDTPGVEPAAGSFSESDGSQPVSEAKAHQVTSLTATPTTQTTHSPDQTTLPARFGQATLATVTTAASTVAPTLVPARLVQNDQPTTTSTIFIASTTPVSSSFSSREHLQTTQPNPLATGGVKIHRALAHSIKVDSISDGVAFNNSTLPANGPKMLYTQAVTTTHFTLPSAVVLADSRANAALTALVSASGVSLASLSQNSTDNSTSISSGTPHNPALSLSSVYKRESDSDMLSLSSVHLLQKSVVIVSESSCDSSGSSSVVLTLTIGDLLLSLLASLYEPSASSLFLLLSFTPPYSNHSTLALYYGSSSVSQSSLPSLVISLSLVVNLSLIMSLSLIANLASSLQSSSSQLSSTTSSIISSSSSGSSSSSKSMTSSSVSSTSSVSTPAARPFRMFAAQTNANGFTGDLFKSISTYAVSGKFSRQALPLTIPKYVSNTDKYQTNKFYVNLFLGDQTDMIWSAPYGMQWSKTTYYGWAVQHTIPSARVFGNVNSNNANPSYYFNPINIQELILSATSFKSNLAMTVTNMKVMSVLAKLGLSTNYLEVPVVQGMGFVTSIYHGNLVAQINSAVGFKTLAKVTSSGLKSNILKYRATLFNGSEYLIYITFPSGTSTSGYSLSVSNQNTIKANKNVDKLIVQVAVAPTSAQEKYYDQSAGTYATEAKIKAHGYGGTTGEYLFVYSTSGSSVSGKPLVFLYPHHLELIDSTTKQAATGITLPSTTKGTMTAFLTNQIVLRESLNYNIQFLPWVQLMGSTAPYYTANQLKLIAQVANSELSVDIKTLVLSMNSNYYSGKVLDKFAYILLVVSDIIGDELLAKSTLKTLKDTFAVFTNNQQYYPLMYDTKFGGVTSTASQNGDTGAEFGSAYYNDHHFHYGYFVHAAAIIGYVDKKYGGSWYKDQQFWVNALIRDVANPSPDDKQFPIFRMFDWFAGHSWAAGLFASGDGRNEESSSEDYNFAYGMKLWGKVSGNQRMESTGDLMLAVMLRAMNKYMYYTSSNTVEPSQILPNKVSGILFENKIDYTTYFGTPKDHPEYVHGIHMLPITPASSLVRGSAFVKEEWQDQISGFIGNVKDGWAGILRLNQALYDASSSYSFFSSSSWTNNYLDNGQSRTWSLAFSAGVANALS